MRSILIALACVGLSSAIPIVGADGDPPPVIPCDRSPGAVAGAILAYPQWFIEALVTRTGEVAGKLKCSAFEFLKLCSREEWPPTVSPFQTNPSGRHGGESPCYEFYAPGSEHLGGCPTAHALRHAFTPHYHEDHCVPLHAVYLAE